MHTMHTMLRAGVLRCPFASSREERREGGGFFVRDEGDADTDVDADVDVDIHRLDMLM